MHENTPESDALNRILFRRIFVSKILSYFRSSCFMIFWKCMIGNLNVMKVHKYTSGCLVEDRLHDKRFLFVGSEEHCSMFHFLPRFTRRISGRCFGVQFKNPPRS